MKKKLMLTGYKGKTRAKKGRGWTVKGTYKTLEECQAAGCEKCQPTYKR